jgi:hypothetical protein
MLSECLAPYGGSLAELTTVVLGLLPNPKLGLKPGGAKGREGIFSDPRNKNGDLVSHFHYIK